MNLKDFKINILPSVEALDLKSITYKRFPFFMQETNRKYNGEYFQSCTILLYYAT